MILLSVANQITFSLQTKLQAGFETRRGTNQPLNKISGQLVWTAAVANDQINPTKEESAPGFKITAVNQ